MAHIHSSPPGQNGHHIANDIFKLIFIYKEFQISLEFAHKGPIDNWSVLVQVMAWRRTGDKPLPEPMMTQSNDVYMHHLDPVR